MTQSKHIIILKVVIACVVTLGIQTTAFAAEPKNRVFFRGGFAQLEDDRSGQIFVDAAGATGRFTDDSGWYAGAGFDFLLSPDTLGLLPGVWTIAELTLEFRNVGSADQITVACALATGGGAGCSTGATQNLNMLSITASPKLKFMEGSNLRPWIIPAGMDFVVISPPSNASNYLDIGIMSGAGIDYMVIPGITLGVDARYHWATGQTSGNEPLFGGGDEDPNAWTVGVSLGIGFN